MARKRGKKKRPAAAKKGKSNNNTPKPSSNSSKQSKTYRKFDAFTKTLRDSLVATCAKTYSKHVDANGGKCARGFVDDLVSSVSEKATMLEITKYDHVNEFRQIKKKKKRKRRTMR